MILTVQYSREIAAREGTVREATITQRTVIGQCLSHRHSIILLVFLQSIRFSRRTAAPCAAASASTRGVESLSVEVRPCTGLDVPVLLIDCLAGVNGECDHYSEPANPKIEAIDSYPPLAGRTNPFPCHALPCLWPPPLCQEPRTRQPGEPSTDAIERSLSDTDHALKSG